MRIITGTARGRALKAPPGLGTRPMLDAQKQMLFNVLRESAVVPGVYDIFAGSGALGLEALSRGAERCVFVERGREAASCLEHNVAGCRFEDRAKIVRVDAFRLDYARLPHDAQVVFVDPPFPLFAEGRERLERLLASLAGTDRVVPGAVIVWRFPEECENVAAPPAFVEFDRREAGRSVIVLYRKEA